MGTLLRLSSSSLSMTTNPSPNEERPKRSPCACLSVVLFASIAFPAFAGELAIPVSIKEMAKIQQGALVQAKGYIRVKQKGDFQLDSLDGGRKIDLDFSESTVSPDAHNLQQAARETIAVEVVGRVDHTRGQDVLVVVGYIRLTP